MPCRLRQLRTDGLTDVRGICRPHSTERRPQPMVTETTFRGQATLVYFGYTGCSAGSAGSDHGASWPAMQLAYRAAHRACCSSLQHQTRITSRILRYLARFDPARMSGLTGKTEALARDLRAAWPEPGSTSHGDLVYVFDGQGRARLLITPQDSDGIASTPSTGSAMVVASAVGAVPRDTAGARGGRPRLSERRTANTAVDVPSNALLDRHGPVLRRFYRPHFDYYAEHAFSLGRVQHVLLHPT